MRPLSPTTPRQGIAPGHTDPGDQAVDGLSDTLLNAPGRVPGGAALANLSGSTAKSPPSSQPPVPGASFGAKVQKALRHAVDSMTIAGKERIAQRAEEEFNSALGTGATPKALSRLALKAIEARFATRESGELEVYERCLQIAQQAPADVMRSEAMQEVLARGKKLLLQRATGITLHVVEGEASFDFWAWDKRARVSPEDVQLDAYAQALLWTIYSVESGSYPLIPLPLIGDPSERAYSEKELGGMNWEEKTKNIPFRTADALLQSDESIRSALPKPMLKELQAIVDRERLAALSGTEVLPGALNVLIVDYASAAVEPRVPPAE